MSFQSASADSQATRTTHAPKKMRKGTHSCLECRRRKIRCIWPSTMQHCDFCSSRGINCVEQTYGGFRDPLQRKKQTMRERISELESNISSILKKIDANERPDKNAVDALRRLQRELRLPSSFKNLEPDALEALRDTGFEDDDDELDSGGGLDNAPLLSLFNNFILTREDEHGLEGCDEAVKSKSDGKCDRKKISLVLRNLRTLVPNRSILTRILEENRVSLFLFQKTFPDMPGLKPFLFDSEIDLFLDHIIEALRSENFVIIAKVVICLSTCLQQLPLDFEFKKEDLPGSLDALQSCFVESAEALLAPDDGVVASLDGIQCLLVQVRYYVNLGLPRKAWVIFRRALTIAQLLGASRDSAIDQRIGLWLQLWALDRIISLLLGLPYAMSRLPCNMEAGREASALVLPPRALFMYNMGKVAGEIIDRNLNHNDISISKTIAIDIKLQECIGFMPSTWWNRLPDYYMPREDIYEMFTSKLSFHNLRILIHLPFVIKSFTSSEFQTNADIALTSARQLIESYRILRDRDRPILEMCNILDFHAFTAGMIIVLVLLAHPSPPITREYDWEIIEGLIQILDRTAGETRHGVAMQAARLLRDLASLRGSYPPSEKSFQATIPYFGKIRFRINQSCLQPVRQQAQPEFYPQMEPILGSVDSSAMEPMLDFNRYLEASDPQSSGIPTAEWSSMVNLGFDEDWSWNFQNNEWIEDFN